MKNTVKRTFKDWFIACRPWSFVAASIATIGPAAYLFYLQGTIGESVTWANVGICLLMMLCFQTAGNLIGDYFDFTKGVDGPDCVNGVTWIHSGLFKPKEILHFGFVMLGICAAIGILLLIRSSFSAIWLGATGLLLALFYFFLKSRLLGDMVILLCFGLLPGIGTSFVGTGNYHPEFLLFCLPFGLHIVAILHANNTRDIASDRQAGLHTVCGQVGFGISQWVYVAEIILPYLLTLVFCLCCGLTWWLAVTFLSLPAAVKNIREMTLHADNNTIKSLDQHTAQLVMLFGLLYALGFVLGAIM